MQNTQFITPVLFSVNGTMI